MSGVLRKGPDREEAGFVIYRIIRQIWFSLIKFLGALVLCCGHRLDMTSGIQERLKLAAIGQSDRLVELARPIGHQAFGLRSRFMVNSILLDWSLRQLSTSVL